MTGSQHIYNQLSFGMGYCEDEFPYHYFNIAKSNPQYLNFEMTNAHIVRLEL